MTLFMTFIMIYFITYFMIYFVKYFITHFVINFMIYSMINSVFVYILASPSDKLNLKQGVNIRQHFPHTHKERKRAISTA